MRYYTNDVADDNVDNVGNKGLCKEEQNKFSKKCYLHYGLNLGPLVIHFDTFLTELTWQVLIEGVFNFTSAGAPIDCWI